MVIWLDDKLLSTHQRFTDFCHEWFGISKFTLEKWTLIPWSLMMCYSMVTGFFFKHQMFILGSVILTWIGLFTIGNILHIELAETKFNETGELINRGIHDQTMRILLVLTWASLVLLDVLLLQQFTLETASYVLFINFIYFSVCLPKPPRKSKVKKMYENALQKISDALDPEPEPSYG